MSREHEEVYQKRDLILAKMDTNLDHVVEWTKTHDVKDDLRFAEVNKKLLWGGIAIVLIASASGMLGQVLEHIKF